MAKITYRQRGGSLFLKISKKLTFFVQRKKNSQVFGEFHFNKLLWIAKIMISL
jgi:hypothetical protein